MDDIEGLLPDTKVPPEGPEDPVYMAVHGGKDENYQILSKEEIGTMSSKYAPESQKDE